MVTHIKALYLHAVNYFLIKGSGKRQVEVLTIADLQKEYLLVKAKLRLLKKDPSLETQLSSMCTPSFCNLSFHDTTCTCKLYGKV